MPKLKTQDDAGALLSEGARLFNAADFPGALSLFQRAAARPGCPPEAECWAAHCLMALGRADEAADRLSALARRLPRYAPAREALALAHQRAGNLDQAAAALSAAARLGSKSAGPALATLEWERAGRALNDGKLERAYVLLRRAARQDPECRAGEHVIELLRAAARAAAEKGDRAGAARAAKELLRLRPGDAQAQRALAASGGDSGRRASPDGAAELALERCQALAASGKTAQAAAVARRALAAAPDPRLRLQLVNLLHAGAQQAASRGRWSRTAAAARELLKLSPPAADEAFGLVGLLFLNGRFAVAQTVLRAARGIDVASIPRPRDRFAALVSLGRYAEAFAVGESILDAGAQFEDLAKFYYPWYPQQWSFLRRRHVRALEALIARKRCGPWPHYYRGFLLQGEQALKAFAPIERWPASRYGWMQMRVGWCFLYQGRYDEAARLLKLSLRSRPHDWRSHGFLAEAYCCLNQGPSAVRQLELAARQGPDKQRGDALAWLGEIQLWLGDYAAAERAGSQALEHGALWAHAWRGAARLLLGRPKDALKDLDEGLRLYPLDREASGWRAEALLALRRPEEALDALKGGGIAPWEHVLRALAHAAKGDWGAFEERYQQLPPELVSWAAKRAKLETDGREGRRDALRALLRLARGFRRENFGRPVFMGQDAPARVDTPAPQPLE